MTRINLVPVNVLMDRHLMAEYRELPMVGPAFIRTLESKRGYDRSRVPPKFTLNTGHVMFFYDKADFLLARYNALIKELRKRGYKILPQNRDHNLDVMFEYSYGWAPTKRDMRMSAARILHRYYEKPHLYVLRKKPVKDYAELLAKSIGTKPNSLMKLLNEEWI